MSDPVAQSPLSLPGPERGSASSDQVSPLVLLHRYLRGRYAIAVALALALAVPFAVLGYNATTPKFRSTGMVRVMPTLPSIAYRIEENQVPPLFDSLVATQAAILRTNRVLARAAGDQRLREAGWPSGAQGVNQLERSLGVFSERSNELIRVTVTHSDPRMAHAALSAVLTAFEEIQEEFSGTNATRRERDLDALQAKLATDLQQKQDEILQLTLAHGGAGHEALFTNRIAEIEKLQNDIRAIDDEIAKLEIQKAAAGGAEPAAGAPPDEVLAMTDPVLGNLFQEQARVEAQIRSMEHDYGPRHPDMVQLRRHRDAVQQQIDGRRRQVVAARLAAGGDLGAAGLNPGLSLDELRQLRERYNDRLKAVDAEFRNIHQVRAHISRLRDQEAEIQRQFIDISNQLSKLRVERQNIAQGRVIVADRGQAPSAPSSDARKQLAALGGMAGAGMGVLMVAAFGFLRHGYRYIDDVEHNALALPLLGTIPDLRTGDPEHDELAALSVHHLRNMLEKGGPAGPRAVHAITSGSSGDGKTSLVLALGMSFAVSGHRTLLLDADLVGRRLSRLLGLSKKSGLGDLVGKTSLNGEVHETRVPNLWAIPAGSSGDFSPEKLSGADFDHLLEQLRGRFDRVIIDTGPILGSLEASLVCPLADRVVLIVSAGQNPRLVEAATRRLQQLGATCAGMVFNRARRDDFDRSVSAAPMSRSVRSVAPPRVEDDNEADLAPSTSLIRALESDRAGRVKEAKR